MPSFKRQPISMLELYEKFVLYYGITAAWRKHQDDTDYTKRSSTTSRAIAKDVLSSSENAACEWVRRRNHSNDDDGKKWCGPDREMLVKAESLTSPNTTGNLDSEANCVGVQDSERDRQLPPPLRPRQSRSDRKTTSYNHVSSSCLDPIPALRGGVHGRQIPIPDKDIVSQTTNLGSRLAPDDGVTNDLLGVFRGLPLNGCPNAHSYQRPTNATCLSVDSALDTSSSGSSQYLITASKIHIPPLIHANRGKGRPSGTITTYSNGTTSTLRQTVANSVVEPHMVEPQYPDPVISSPPSFQQRLIELTILESDTIRFERNRKTKKRHSRDS